jgi:glycosyltransferase A (GT-A) superfamily protein (DUF2064 family)
MQVLVVAKAPVAGQAKTRLGARVGDAAAARIASAALADTLRAATAAAGPASCHLALAGELDGAAGADRLRDLLRGWTVTGQRGDDFAERLVNAHLDAGPGDVVQIGMDTPQVTPALLDAAARSLADHDAVLGAAEDGGWWVLARRDPASVRVLAGVPMSTPTTYADTRAALVAAGASVGDTPRLRDVDTVADAHAVAEQAPDTEFARAWSAVVRA